MGTMLEQAWDGDWYRRAYFDDGTPLGSAQAQECRIDAISQSWAVLSGTAPPRRAERAMDAVRMQLGRRDGGGGSFSHAESDQPPPHPRRRRALPGGALRGGGRRLHAPGAHRPRRLDLV